MIVLINLNLAKSNIVIKIVQIESCKQGLAYIYVNIEVINKKEGHKEIFGG